MLEKDSTGSLTAYLVPAGQEPVRFTNLFPFWVDGLMPGDNKEVRITIVYIDFNMVMPINKKVIIKIFMASQFWHNICIVLKMLPYNKIIEVFSKLQNLNLNCEDG